MCLDHWDFHTGFVVVRDNTLHNPVTTIILMTTDNPEYQFGCRRRSILTVRNYDFLDRYIHFNYYILIKIQNSIYSVFFIFSSM